MLIIIEKFSARFQKKKKKKKKKKLFLASSMHLLVVLARLSNPDRTRRSDRVNWKLD